MANVSKINGYDVKDSVARGDIADIQQDLSTAQGDITTLQNDVSDTKADLGNITALATTVKTSAVNAINEVNGKAEDNADNIGTLSALSTTAKSNLVNAINEVDSHADTNTANFAPAFSDVTSYAVGDYVTYNGVLYKCTTAHSAGVWGAGHFTQVTVSGDFVGNTVLGKSLDDTASVTIPVATGITGTVRAYRKNGVVSINIEQVGNMENSSDFQHVLVATLADKYKPKMQMNQSVVLAKTESDTVVRIYGNAFVETNGRILVACPWNPRVSGLGYLWVSFTYVAADV